jgi:hypothetical protein
MPPVNWKALVEQRRVDPLRPNAREIAHHLELAEEHLAVAGLAGIPERQRFLKLYDAAHGLTLAGLLLAGYRPKAGEGNRQLCLSLAEETLALRHGTAAAFTEANRLRAAETYHGVPADYPKR